MLKTIYGIVYWFLQLTWGILLNIAGLFVFLACVIFGKAKVHRNGFGLIAEIGGNWGGFSSGAFAICGRYAQEDGPCYNPYWFEHTRKHEFGHSIQNAALGPFTIFLVEIPSACRYWYYRAVYAKGKVMPVDWYDSVWFEGTATNWGTNAVDYIEGIKHEN